MTLVADLSALFKVVLCCLVAGFFLGFCAAESGLPEDADPGPVAPSHSVSAR